MKTVKILHCADVHIGAAVSFLGAAAEKRRYETLLTFEKIIDTARENGVEVIAIAGDLFDSNNIEETLIKPVFEKIASVPHIKLLLALGNHDPLSATSPFKTREIPDNLYILPPKDSCITFDDLKLRVYGKSFNGVYMQGEDSFSIQPPEDDFINLMVLHGEAKSDLLSNYNSVTPQFIKGCKMDYVALGHIHKRTEIAKIDSTYFAYSGCPEGQGFDETGEKGVYMGEIGKGFCALEFVPTAKRIYIYERADISGLSSPAEISEKILSDLSEKYGGGYAENLYKIELCGAVPAGAEIKLAEINARIADKLYFVKLKDATEYEIDTESLSEEISLKGLFVKNILKRQENASEEEKEALKAALNLGLKAFFGEVAYNED